MQTSNWLLLAKSIPATLGDEKVVVRDIGDRGAFCTTRKGCETAAEKTLRFTALGVDVTVQCRVSGRTDYHEGDEPCFDLMLRFLDRSASLESFVALYREQISRAARANAQGRGDENRIDGDRTLSDLGSAVRESTDLFIRCRFIDQRWSREITASAEQAVDGFTVSSCEPEEQIKLLRLAYEESDTEGRRLLREFAADSLAPDPRRVSLPEPAPHRRG